MTLLCPENSWIWNNLIGNTKCNTIVYTDTNLFKLVHLWKTCVRKLYVDIQVQFPGPASKLSCVDRSVPSTDFVPLDAQDGIKAAFHLTISMRGQRATGKIQRNNYHDGSCGPSLTSKTSSVSLIFTHGTHWNVKNRWVRSSLQPSAFIQRFRDFGASNPLRSRFSTHALQVSRSSLFDLHPWDTLESQKSLSEK